MLSSRVLKISLVALALSGAAVTLSLPAHAGERTGTWRNGMVDGPYGPGWYGPDGTFYGNDQTVRRRGYAREYYRSSRDYDDYYEDPYARPRGYRGRDRYSTWPYPNYMERRSWESGR
jgi:hypothetical protein